ncbi:hypothetical protein [Brumicola blandensis]|jgi:hypothetical protein|uniref:Uncharacterized protein n=1 Tax=Brumicola blandensis TaxID=3075611 RepID=A0AAW8R4A0_9ALTE|nr:hypothetical protein [Alteromonas sp. W409]MDT0583869.1 hypothetical protein [Alteromonas sp. W409]
MRLFSTLVFAVILPSCSLLPSIKDRVYVMEQGPNSYIVTVGWGKFSELTKMAISTEDKVSLLSGFALEEVVARGLCESAGVPNGDVELLGWEGRGDKGIRVVCTNLH